MIEYTISNYLTLYKDALNSFYSNPYAFLPIIMYCAFVTKYDMESMKIPNDLNKLFLMLRFLLIFWIPIRSENIIGFILGGLLILIPAMVINRPMGGDIKFCAVLGAWTNDAIIMTSLALGIILFVANALIRRYDRKKMVAFGPFVCLGLALMSVIYGLIKLSAIL